MNKLDLGAVSAYAMAKEKGYEGTEDEFATLMAESGDNALRAEAAKERAEEILGSIPQDYATLSQNVVKNAGDITALTQEIAAPWEKRYINAFDGKYIDGYAVGGDTTLSLSAHPERYNLAIIKVKPNTTYTIIATNNGENIPIFRVCLSSKLLSVGEDFDNEKTYTSISGGTKKITTITTGENDQYMYVYGVNYLSPTRTQFIQVAEGELEDFTTDKYDVYQLFFNTGVVPEIEQFYTSQTDFEVVHRIFADDGTSIYSPNFDATVLIPVTKGSVIDFTASIGEGYHSLLLYDGNMVVVGTAYENIDNARQYVVEDDAIKYVRVQSRNSNWGATKYTLSVTVKSSRLSLLENEEPFAASIRLVKNSATQIDVYVPNHDGRGEVRYYFARYQKTWDSLTFTDENGDEQTALNVISSDYWNNLYVYDCDGNEIVQGNSNFICKVTGESFHVGNGHGNEVILYCAFVADGRNVDIDALSVGEVVYCNNLRLIEKTNMYAVGGGTEGEYNMAYPALDADGKPIVNFVHTMEMDIRIGNDIRIDNKLLVMRDGITFSQCHGAMLECYFGDFTTVNCNNAESTQNSIDSNGVCTTLNGSSVNLKETPAQKCNWVEMYGGKFYVSQRMQQNDPARHSKSNVYFVFYNNRLKTYFQPVVAGLGLQEGENREIFNAGDVISVTAHRKIDYVK